MNLVVNFFVSFEILRNMFVFFGKLQNPRKDEFNFWQGQKTKKLL